MCARGAARRAIPFQHRFMQIDGRAVRAEHEMAIRMRLAARGDSIYETTIHARRAHSVRARGPTGCRKRKRSRFFLREMFCSFVAAVDGRIVLLLTLRAHRVYCRLMCNEAAVTVTNQQSNTEPYGQWPSMKEKYCIFHEKKNTNRLNVMQLSSAFAACCIWSLLCCEL